MGAKAYYLFHYHGLEPGASIHFQWYDPPEAMAYAMDARPYVALIADEEPKMAKAEITRFLHRMEEQLVGASTKPFVSKTESLSGYVKNVGEYPIGFEMYLITFSAS